MLMVSLCGAPGAGKSTGAAYIFSKLKMLGVNAELVMEYAKDKVWEKNDKALENQAYIFGKQYFRISKCAEGVDVIVTDSPLFLSIIYNRDSRLGKDFDNAVVNVYKSFNTLNYFVNRVKKYNPNGRLQTEEESDRLVDVIKDTMFKYQIFYKNINGDVKGYDFIVDEVMEKLSENEKENN